MDRTELREKLINCDTHFELDQIEAVLALIDPERITPDEATELQCCFGNESLRRYGKVNTEAPLYKKLQTISKA